MITVFFIGAIMMGIGATLAAITDSKAFRKGIGGKIVNLFAGDNED